MQGVGFAGIAILLHLQSFLQGLLVLVRKVVNGLTLGTFELDHVVLGHRIFLTLKFNYLYTIDKKRIKVKYRAKVSYF